MSGFSFYLIIFNKYFEIFEITFLGFTLNKKKCLIHIFSNILLLVIPVSFIFNCIILLILVIWILVKDQILNLNSIKFFIIWLINFLFNIYEYLFLIIFVTMEHTIGIISLSLKLKTNQSPMAECWEKNELFKINFWFYMKANMRHFWFFFLKKIANIDSIKLSWVYYIVLNR